MFARYVLGDIGFNIGMSIDLLQSILMSFLLQGPKQEAAAGLSGGSIADTKPSGSSASGASTDKYRNYAVLAGTITALGAIGWYLKASKKKPEVQD